MKSPNTNRESRAMIEDMQYVTKATRRGKSKKLLRTSHAFEVTKFSVSEKTPSPTRQAPHFIRLVHIVTS